MVCEEGSVNAGVGAGTGADTGAGVGGWWEWFGAGGRGDGGVCERGVGHFDFPGWLDNWFLERIVSWTIG